MYVGAVVPEKGGVLKVLSGSSSLLEMLRGNGAARQVGREQVAVTHHDAAVDDAGGHIGGRAEHQRGHGVMARARVTHARHVEGHEVGRHARRQRADVVAPQHARAAQRGDLQRLARAHGGRAVAHALQQQGLARLAQHVGAVVGGAAVHAQAHGHARIAHGAHGCDARGQAHVGAGAMRHARARAREQRNALGIELDAVGMPDIGTDPAQAFGVLRGGEAEFLAREGDVVVVLGQVGVQRHAVRTRQHGGLAHQLARHRERRARRQHHAQHGVACAVVVLLDQAQAVAQDGFLFLHHRVGRQAALAAAQAHGAARRMKAHAHLLRRGDGVVQPSAIRIQVQVVAGGGAARQHQLGHGGLGGDVDHLRREVRPQHVQVGQPREQLRILRGRHGAREALVHVVVRIDQARHHHAAAHVQHLGRAVVHHAAVLRRQIGRGAHPLHGRAVGHQGAVADLAALRIHGDEYIGVQCDQGHGVLFFEMEKPPV